MADKQTVEASDGAALVAAAMAEPTDASTDTPPSVDATLSQWALAQAEPFTAAHALEALRHAGAAPSAARALAESDVAERLGRHPSVACWDGRYYTPGILARRLRFVIRLMPDERARHFLVPGHRFLPFLPFDADPSALELFWPNGKLLPPSVALMDHATIAACERLRLGRSGVVQDQGPAQGSFVSGFHLDRKIIKDRAFTGELLVSCTDFGKKKYAIEPFAVGSTPTRAADEKRIQDALEAVCGSELAGPLTAARQALHALARCLPLLANAPIGPLGPILTQTPGVRLETGPQGAFFMPMDSPGSSLVGGPALRPGRTGRTGRLSPEEIEERLERILPSATGRGPARATPTVPALSLAPPMEAAAAHAPDVARALELLGEAIAGMTARARGKRGAYAQAMQGLRWDPVEGRFCASFRERWQEHWQLFLQIDLEKVDVKGGCECNLRGAAACDHLAGLIECVHRTLRVADHAVTRAYAEDAASPPWQRALRRLDSVVQGPSTAQVADKARPSRLIWRLSRVAKKLELQIFEQKVSKAGGWTAGRRLRVEDLLYRRELEIGPADRAAAHGYYANSRFGWSSEEDADGSEAALVSPLLALVGHPCVTWQDNGDTPVDVAVRRTELRLKAATREKGGLKLAVTLEERPVDGCKDLFPCADGCIFFDREKSEVLVAPASPTAIRLMAAIRDVKAGFPAEATEELLARVPKLEAVLPIDLPAEIGGESVPPDGRLRLLLTPERVGGVTAALRARPVPDGAGVYVPGGGLSVLTEVVAGKRLLVRRDLKREEALAHELTTELGLDGLLTSRPFEWRLYHDEEALDFLDGLEARSRADLVVEWPADGRKIFVTREALPKDLHLEVKEDRDWFGISGTIELDGETVPLTAVLDSLRRGRRYVPISAGKLLKLSQSLRDRLAELTDVAHSTESGLQVGRVAAPVISDLFREAGVVAACEAWEDMRKRFDRAMQLSPNPPATLSAELRDYQLEGYRWLRRLAEWGVGGCLADDMGLGKTVQALGVLIDRAPGGPALVVAPTSVGSNWIRETRRFAPTLNPILYRETDRETEAGADAYRAGDVVVASYGLVLRDADRLEKVRWGTLILDEAQFVKNAHTKTASAIRRLVADWRLALTGTPIENRLAELWSLFRSICPGLFGSWDRFREQFAGPVERDKDAGRRHALARLVRPFILRRTKAEVLDELPPRTEIQLTVQLGAEERRLYDESRLAALAQLTGAVDAGGEGGGAGAGEGVGEDRRFQVLAALTRLRQLACHPRLVHADAAPESSKLTVFLETVEELRAGHHRALVFSQFTRYLALVREALDARQIPYQYLDGQTPPRAREEAVDAFQGGNGELFLISLKAGGTGLNLTAADYVVHLDPWWNPAVEDQATDRAHRIGQTRPVTVYRLVAAGTVEEQILALHADKRGLVAGVLEGADQAGKLSTAELIGLIRGEG
ncbi:MAG: DEAD/DEAH box helicase [Planctomycetes bacterium]|nr:DEAD/DEAH box helicase [Planctomycetota bacterium]